MRGPTRRSERGAAVIMALLIVALATLIVSGLFWRQFVLIRTIENQQTVAQTRLLLRGALDWARAILRQQSHPLYDSLTDPWAQPLQETRLDQLGETSPLASQATISGAIEDAQARFNLRNLVAPDGSIVPAQLAVLSKLAAMESLPSQAAEAIAAYVAQSSFPRPPATPGTPASARPVPLVFGEDLSDVPGIDPAAAQNLEPFVVMLDQSNVPVNFNTASPEVMAAVIPDLTISDAKQLAADRDRAYFINPGEVQLRLHGRGGTFPAASVATASQYFLVNGTVRLDRATTRMQALVKRGAQQGPVEVLWERER
ncbi:MAG TPA: type II secretion system minor pseudopilin GspK [Burkholderiaceae bacterium]